MKPYADSNFFTRVYLRLESGTSEANALLKLVALGNIFLPITRLHRLEVLNAFEMTAFQSAKQGQHRITRESAAIAQATFRDDCREQSFLRLCTPAEAAVDRQYEELALRHTAARGFRTYDLLHVAQALTLGCDTFWSFDEKANALAVGEGLATRIAP
jgi:predicted nucleic acid-binding protein